MLTNEHLVKECELVENAHSTLSGYSFSDKFKTVSKDGVISTSYSVTFPDGSIQLCTDYGDGCHCAVDDDNCGCDKCKSKCNNQLNNSSQNALS